MAEGNSIPACRNCTKCGQTLPLSEYTKDSRGKYGRSARCRSCARKYAQDNRVRISEVALQRYHRLQEPIRQERAERRVAAVTSPTKECSRCGTVYEKSFFKKRKSSVDGLHGHCRLCCNELNRIHRKNNPEMAAAWSAKWAANNPEIRREKYRRWLRKPKNRVHMAITARVYERLKTGKGGRRTEELLGYSFDELVRHIELQFLQGMSWENYGSWHVDHIIPLSSFDISTREDPAVRQAWALSNLRPLWAHDNLSKGCRIVTLL